MSRLKDNFTAYSSAATAHGFYYVGSPQVSGPLRIFWAVIVIVSLAVAGVIVNQTLREWEDSPMTTDIDIFAFDSDVRHTHNYFFET